MSDGKPQDAPGEGGQDRRGFLGAAAGLTMAGGLVAGYGAFAAAAGRYLYPAHGDPTTWMFVADLGTFRDGASLTWRAPDGSRIVIARKGDTGSAADFRALSSTCPHLGCQVHWEAANNRFFCPCHNGVFDPEGMGTAGPPAGKALARYPLRVENGLLFIEVPATRLHADAAGGRDPVLGPGPGPAPGGGA